MEDDGSDKGEDCSCWENEELGVGVGTGGGLGPIDKARRKANKSPKKTFFKGIAETAQLGLATIQGMEPADQYAYLKTEIKTREAALRAKDVELHLRDALLKSKDAVIESKNAVIHAIDAEMKLLQAELAVANRMRNKKRCLLALSGLNARHGNKHRNFHADPADPALAPLLAQQPQVHFIHLLPSFLLLCHPIASAPPPPPQVQACADEAERLLVAGQYKAAAEQLLQAIGMGHLPSRALMAWLLVWGREGIAKDQGRALELVEEGVHMGCKHCQGVLAFCIHNDQWYMVGDTIVMRDDDPAQEQLMLRSALHSSESGSRYGHYVLGKLYCDQDGNIGDRALYLWQQAADQGLDAAQLEMGHSLYSNGTGNLDDYPEALRLYRLAAAQGHPDSIFCVGFMHELGHGVPADAVEALVWYKRAAAEGHKRAALCVQKLGAQ